MTFSSEFAHQTGREFIGGDLANADWWNLTGSVWVISIITEDLIITDLGLVDNPGAPWPVSLSKAVSLGPKSRAFTISVPSQGCNTRKPDISWTVEATATSAFVCPVYTLAISAEYPCASNTIVNPPQCTHNTNWAVTQTNWRDANVDQMMYDWWFNYDDCEISSLGGSHLPNLSPPNTSNDLTSELAYWAANIDGFSCQMSAAADHCKFSTDPCDYPGIPRWAFLALVAVTNLHYSLANIDDQLFKATTANGLLTLDTLNKFKKHPNTQPGYLVQLLLLIIGTVLSIIGIFFPIAVPALAAAEEAVAGETAAEALNLAQKAVNSLGQASTAPLKAPANFAGVYGSIPGAIIVGIGGTWGKIVSKATNPQQAETAYDALLEYNWEQMTDTLEKHNDALYGNSSYAAMLMTTIFGGIYVETPTYSIAELRDLMIVDLTSRMINNMWIQYQAYVQFTDLGDDDSKAKCHADTHGPYVTRYCADGGVYYLRELSGGADTGKPYAFDQLTALAHPIKPWWISAASSRVYQQYGLKNDFTDPGAFSNAVGVLIANNLRDLGSLIGQLPGEWTLPVCDGGKNYYGYDYTNNEWKNSTGPAMMNRYGGPSNAHSPWKYTPCACGYQGNETAQFYNTTGMQEIASNVAGGCEFVMSSNNNQGFLQLRGGPPPNGEITIGPGNTYTMTASVAPPVVTDPPFIV